MSVLGIGEGSHLHQYGREERCAVAVETTGVRPLLPSGSHVCEVGGDIHSEEQLSGKQGGARGQDFETSGGKGSTLSERREKHPETDLGLWLEIQPILRDPTPLCRVSPVPRLAPGMPLPALSQP